MTTETSNARGETYTFDMIEDAWGDAVPLTKPYFDRFRARLETLRQQSAAPPPAAAGEEIMVNAAHDVYTLPLQPSGLSSGPRFVVHVPEPEARGAVEFDGTDREVLREFIRICREHKPVGPWPGERVCKAIERAMDNEKPFRFIAEADMAPERAPSMKDADRMLSGPRRAAPPPAAAQQQGLTESWQDEWRSAVAAKLSSYGLSEEAAAVFAESELGEYRAGLCDCAENDPADMVDLMMGVALDAIEKWKAESAGRPFGYKRTAPPSAPVGVDAPGSRAWMAEVCRAAALSLAAHGVRNDQLSKVADWIAQQPAAARVDVRGLVALAEQMERDAAGCRRDGYIDAAVVKEDCAQRIRQTLGISAIAEALAAEGVQAEPNAEARGVVDEAMVERAWVAFCEDTGPARAAMRAALTAALTGERNG